MDDVPVKRKSLFFNNLILLGLDQTVFERKYGVSIHKDMFVLPNKKDYEVVTHFLFSKLSAVTNKDYELPWPLTSKELDRVFQKTCFSHLTNFAQENIIMFPRMVPSVLSTFGGDRFYEVYLAFSSYVLIKTMHSKGYYFHSRPEVTRDNFPMAREILQLSTVLSMQRLRETQNLTYANHLLWLKFTKNLSECLAKSKNMLKTNKDFLKEKENILGSLLSIVPSENMNFHATVMENICTHYKPLHSLSGFHRWRMLLCSPDDDCRFAIETLHRQHMPSTPAGAHLGNELPGMNIARQVALLSKLLTQFLHDDEKKDNFYNNYYKRNYLLCVKEHNKFIIIIRQEEKEKVFPYFCPTPVLPKYLETCKLVKRLFMTHNEQLKEINSKLDNFLSSEAELWQYLTTDIGECSESHILDGHMYNICRADEMPEGYHSEMQKTGVNSSEENGKLSILRFMKLLQAHLKVIFDILLRADFSQLDKTCSTEDLSSHQEILHYINNLVKKLYDDVPDLEQSIENLKLMSGFNELNMQSSTTARSSFPCLPVLSFDPEAVKGRVPDFKPGELFSFSFSDFKETGGIHTDSSSLSEKDPSGKFSLISLTNINVPGDLVASSKAEGYTEMTSYTKSLLMDMTKKDLYTAELSSKKIEVPIANTPVVTQNISISDLDDLSFGPTCGYRMSETFLLDQTFNSVALPDTSFDD